MENSSLTICVLFSLLTIAVCTAPKWKYCDDPPKYEASVSATATSATVDSQGEIHLKKGTNVTVSVTFKMTGGPATSATAVVHGIIAGLPVPFSIPNPNACKDSGLTCPLKAPGVYTYKAVIPVKKEFPKIRLVVKWQLNDQSGKTIWCVEMPAQIEG